MEISGTELFKNLTMFYENFLAALNEDLIKC